MRITCHALLAGAISCFVVTAFAALPEPGYWSFDSELDGKPGRGLQIERQGGETVILSYYGYRKDGSATFYQASGKIAKQETFTADLFEYKNGPTLGGPVQSGEISQKVGTADIKFDTSQSGTISLPGQQPQAISRFVYADSQRQLSNMFSVSFFGKKNYLGNPYSARVRFYLTDNQLDLVLDSQDGISCNYSGDLKREGSGLASVGQITPCNDFFKTVNPLTYAQLINLKVSEDGVLSGIYRAAPDERGPFDEYQISGRCYGAPGAVILLTPPIPCTARHLGLEQPAE